jgi:O-antigen ligase
MIQRYELFAGLILLATFFSWTRVKEKYGWIAFALLVWVLFEAILLFYWPLITIDTLSLRLRLVSARSFALVTMLIYFMTKIQPWHIKHMVVFFEVLTLINCGLYLYFGHGVMNAGSVDMAFMAMVYPMMLFRKKLTWSRIIILVLPPACVFFKRSGSTVFFALALGIGAGLLLQRKWYWVLASTAACLGVGKYIADTGQGGLLSDSGRFEPWTVIMNWWVEWANMWMGTGTGSFQWLGPTIQNKENDLLIFMHNEYLQVIFEQGVIGFALMLAMIFLCLKGARKSPWLLAPCMSTLFVFVTQMPLRFIFSQLFILMLMRLCLDEDTKKFAEYP